MNNIKAACQQIATMFNVSASALECMTRGVIERIEHFGIERFKKLSDEKRSEVLMQAVQNYFECQRKFFENYQNNVNGTRDNFIRQVYDEVKQNEMKKAA